MKKCLAIAFLTLPTLCFGQHSLFVDNDTKLITFEKVYELDTLKADFIFDKVKGWFVDYFRQSTEVIRGENKPNLIKGTFITDYAAAMGMRQDYYNDIQVRIKDGAIKITIDNLKTVAGLHSSSWAIEVTGTKTDGIIKTGTGITKAFVDIDNKCKKLADDIYKAITTKGDW